MTDAICEEVNKKPLVVSKRMHATYIKMVRANKIPDTKEIMSKFQEISRPFKDFITKYNIPSRQMLVNGEFHPKAFSKYLKDADTKTYDGPEGWAKLQANYIRYLFLALNKGMFDVKKQASELYEKTWKSLHKEMVEFKEDYNEAKIQAKELELRRSEDRRQMLIRMIKQSNKIQNIVSNSMVINSGVDIQSKVDFPV